MKKITILALSLLLPIVTFAQNNNTNLTGLQNLARGIGEIVKILIPVTFGLAILAFFWGVALYIFGGEQDKEVAKKRMLWGVIAIFVIASIWGIVRFLGDSFGLGTQTQPPVNIDLPNVTN